MFSAGISPEKEQKRGANVAPEGNASAQYQLYLCYRDGAGVMRDPAEATNWLRKAAAQGDKAAQAALNAPADQPR